MGRANFDLWAIIGTYFRTGPLDEVNNKIWYP